MERKHSWKPQEKTVAIQGFANADHSIARLLHNDGYRIVAVSDSQGAILRKERLDIPSVIRIKNEGKNLKAVYCDGSVCEAQDAEQLEGEKLLELDVDILIPAAMEDVITSKNVSRVKAKTILELANGPLSAEADDALVKGHPRHPCQRRRGHRELLRMGAKSQWRLLGRRGNHQQSGETHASTIPQRAEPR